MKWFRFYNGVLHDPKVQRLPPALFKHWVNLLCLTSCEDADGELPSIDDIAFALRVKPVEATKIMMQLRRAGLVDSTQDGRDITHNWTQRQRNSDDVASRVRSHRARKQAENDAPETDNVTLQKRFGNGLDIDIDIDIEREETHTQPSSLATSDAPDPAQPVRVRSIPPSESTSQPSPSQNHSQPRRLPGSHPLREAVRLHVEPCPRLRGPAAEWEARVCDLAEAGYAPEQIPKAVARYRESNSNHVKLTLKGLCGQIERLLDDSQETQWTPERTATNGRSGPHARAAPGGTVGAKRTGTRTRAQELGRYAHLEATQYLQPIDFDPATGTG